MRKAGATAAVYVLPACAIVFAWLRTEHAPRAVGAAFLIAVIALVPALADRARVRVLLIACALLFGSWIAVGASPVHPLRVLTRLWDGGREFYDVSLQFDPVAHPRMQGAILLAILVFCLLLGLALAGRRALLAVLVLAFGAGWPGTLLRGGSDLVVGGLILAAALVILTGTRARARTVVFPAFVAGGLVLVCAVALASRPAIAKNELLHWQGWDLYTKADRAVGVSYVWDSNYRGLNWPKKKTVVLNVKAPDTPFYWRATTLDTFVGENWVEALKPARQSFEFRGHVDLVPNKGSRRGLVHQEVTVEALNDRHLIGAEVPVAYDPRGIESVSYMRSGVALVVPGRDRGHTYGVWSAERHPAPKELAAAKPVYPMSIDVDGRTSVPSFGTPGRDKAVRLVLKTLTPAYSRLYAIAKRVVGRARTPYAAVVAIESWLRDSGQFTYDAHPPTVPGVPPLVAFVAETHRGYCQHFGGAMALMLRYLGIPARVAAGFTSGTYSNHTWTVTDHDAHAWVEVWFRGYGWLPFDPTPGRGSLQASYSASSKSFDAGAAAALVGAGSLMQRLLRNEALQSGNGSSVRGEHARSVPVLTPAKHRALLIVGLILLGIIALAAGVFFVKSVRRRLRYMTADPREIAAACRRELSEILRDQRVEVPASATLQELGTLLDAELEIGADVLVEAAGSARFAPPAAAAEAAGRTRVEARELRRVLRRRLSTYERFTGALSLRSLRSA